MKLTSMSAVTVATLFATSTFLVVPVHSSRLTIKAGLPLQNTAELDRVFTAVSNPDNSEYLEFKTDPQSLAELVGPSEVDVQRVIDWFVSDLGCPIEDVVVSNVRDTVTCRTLALEASDLATNKAWNSDQWAPESTAYPIPLDFVLVGSENDFQDALDVSNKATHAARETLLQSAYDEPNSFYTIANTKKAYGIPVDLQAASDNVSQMVWGPGTFGYSKSELEFFKSENCPLMNTKKVVFDTENHGSLGGDNFGEGQLDTEMTASFGLNVLTIVSNTNTSHSAEEGNGFGEALLDFVTDLYARDTVRNQVHGIRPSPKY